jgi:hypothetical protein
MQRIAAFAESYTGGRSRARHRPRSCETSACTESALAERERPFWEIVLSALESATYQQSAGLALLRRKGALGKSDNGLYGKTILTIEHRNYVVSAGQSTNARSTVAETAFTKIN